MRNILLSIIVVLLAMGCSRTKGFKVGFLHPSNKRMRFVKETNFFSDRIKQLGGQAIVVDADDNETLQLERGYKLLEEDEVDLLVIAAVNGNTIAPLVRKAKSMGVPVIAYNMLISNVGYDIFFSGDNAYLAELFCQSALSAKPTGNYVVLGGDRFDRNGYELKMGIDSILKPHVDKGEIRIVYNTFIESWSRDNAAFEFDQVLQSHGDGIDAVLSSNDMMADGVIKVWEKNHIQKPLFISGQDADIVGIRNVYKGKQSMTVYHPAKKYGYSAAQLAMDILHGKKVKELANGYVFNGYGQIPNIKIKSIKITSDNIDRELVTAGECTWEDIKKE
jgi:D-xylose transport system substrate-binding protein